LHAHGVDPHTTMKSIVVLTPMLDLNIATTNAAGLRGKAFKST
jgi:hypothetical protein